MNVRRTLVSRRFQSLMGIWPYAASRITHSRGPARPHLATVGFQAVMVKLRMAELGCFAVRLPILKSGRLQIIRLKRLIDGSGSGERTSSTSERSPLRKVVHG